MYLSNVTSYSARCRLPVVAAVLDPASGHSNANDAGVIKLFGVGDGGGSESKGGGSRSYTEEEQEE